MFTINHKQKQTLLNLLKKINRSAGYVVNENIVYYPLDSFTIRFAFTENLEKSVYVDFYGIIHNDPLESRFIISINALKLKDALSFSAWQDKTVAHLDSGANVEFDVVSSEFYPIIPIYPFESEGVVSISSKMVDFAMTIKSNNYMQYVFGESAQALLTSIIAIRSRGSFGDEISTIDKKEIKIAYEFGSKINYKIYEHLISLSVTNIAEYKIVWQIPKIKFDKKFLNAIMFAFKETNIVVEIEPNVIKSLTSIDKDSDYAFYFDKESNCFKHGIFNSYTGKLTSQIKSRSNPKTDVGFAIKNDIAKKILSVGAVYIKYSDTDFRENSAGIKYTTSAISVETANEQVIVAPVILGINK